MSKVRKFSFTFVFVICLLCAFLCGGALAEETDNGVSYTETPVYVDGLLSCRGYTIGENTYVSLEAISSVLGFNAASDFNKEINTLTVNVADIQIIMCADEDVFYANGRCLWLPDGYMEIEGNVIIPLEAVSRIFSLDISWNEEIGVFDLNTANKAILSSGEEFYNADDLYWLSRVITWESGNQPMEGQIAVGNVVMNRIESGRFPANTVKDVIFQPGQFAVVETGAIYGEPFDISIVCAKLALEGYNTVGDALFFQTGRYGGLADMAAHVATIADHNFFV